MFKIYIINQVFTKHANVLRVLVVLHAVMGSNIVDANLLYIHVAMTLSPSYMYHLSIY